MLDMNVMLHAWIMILLAVAFEAAGVTSMKLSEGFSRTLPSILIFVFYGFAFYFLTLSIKYVPLSVAYSVWSGMGTAVTACIGVLWFKERLGREGVLGIVLIAAGIIVIKLGSAAL